MRRLAVVMVSGLLALTACTGSSDAPASTTPSVPSPEGATAPSDGQAGDGTGAQAAAFVPFEAIGLLDSVSSCAQGLQDLADNPYVYPADPAQAGENRAWTDVFGEFQSGHLPACQAVGAFVDAHRSEPPMSAVDDALDADGRGGWTAWFDDDHGIVRQGSRIATYCPAEHLAQFDCEQALIRIGESTMAVRSALALVASAVAPSATAVAEVAAEQAQPLQVAAAADRVEVAETGTALEGMTITPAPGSDADVSGVTVASAGDAGLPNLPGSVTALSEPFAVDGTAGGSVEVRLGVPGGTDVSSVRLFALASAPGHLVPSWTTIGQAMRYEQAGGEQTVVVPVGEFAGIARWGANSTQPAVEQQPTTQGALWFGPAGGDATAVPAGYATTAQAPTTQVPVTSSPARPDGVRCTSQAPQNERPYDLCSTTTAGHSDLTTRVFDWGPSATRFGGLTKEDVSAVVFDTIAWQKGAGLGFSTTTDIVVEDIGNLAGVVYPTTPDTAKVIHLSNDPKNGDPKYMRGTVVHELFHAAQGNAGTATGGAGTTLLAPTGDLTHLGWLIEGTAEWSIDEVYDGQNLFAYSGPRILEPGLNAASSQSYTSPAFPYERGTFFKFLNSSCPGFTTSLKPLMNANVTKDVTALGNFTSVLAGLPCDFGGQLGADRKADLVSALVYYNWATQSEGKLSLLDGNESANAVAFEKPADRTNVTYPSVEQWPTGAQSRFSPFALNSASARSFVVPAVSGTLPKDKVVELAVGVSNPQPASATTEPIVVSLTSTDGRFRGTTTMGPGQVASDAFTAPMATAAAPPSNAPSATTSQSAAPSTPRPNWQTTSYVYRTGQSVPEVFLTVANPNVDAGSYVGVRISLTIRDRVDGDPAG